MRPIDASRIDANQQTIYDYVAKKWCRPIDIPTIDVIEVVRCKNCKLHYHGYCNQFDWYTEDEEYCAWGRKDE